MAGVCPRLFEVEAARDGRLAGDDLARFESHLARCAACSAEHRTLDSLGASLRELPVVTGDELHARRERTRLLAGFNARLVPPRTSAKRWLVPLLGAASLTLLTLTLWYSRAPSSAPTLAVRDAIAVRPAPSTEWSRQVESHRDTIKLAAGTLSVSIDHTLSPRRVRVLLPDGELEDLGTTFSVTVAAGATTHVSVQDGTVILRLRDRAPIVLGVNESWSPKAPTLRAPAPHAAPPPPAPRAPANAGAPAREPSPAPSAPEATRDTSTTDAAASDFRAAFSALNGGDNLVAATLFATFLTRHPTDPRAEDAAYLRVIALQRTGSTPAMNAAALDYLRRYPQGFRRAEVEAIQK
jgi:hypothetical protein